ncbi:GNAT family N-acetyltransferase [Roseateles chitinivorans]|uniref:GNAT family N-acetyltransferase n=1 Tax=Roseateles chitinivorans TaxID=2917965 RepID=UPI003D67895F
MIGTESGPVRGAARWGHCAFLALLRHARSHSDDRWTNAMTNAMTNATTNATTTAIAFRHAETLDDLRACHPLMLQLRPQLTGFDAFAGIVERQSAQGYRLLMGCADDTPVALAGYRCLDNLIHGRFLYVDDLVTASSGRGRGIGDRTLAALRRIARDEGCARLVLDTALSNSLAQRFYFRSGLLARGLHFSMDLT